MHYYTNILTTFDGTVVENVYAAGLKQERSKIEESVRQTSTERRGTSSRVTTSSERYFLTRFQVSTSVTMRSAGLRYVKSATSTGSRRFLIRH